MPKQIVSVDEEAIKGELRGTRQNHGRRGHDGDVPGRSLHARGIEDASEILCGAKVSAGTVSNLNERASKSVEEWRSRPLEGECPYIYIDGIYLKRSWGGSYENVAVTIAIGVTSEGYREIIGCAEGFTEPKESWREFLAWLKSRELKGIRTFTDDKSLGMLGALRGGGSRSEV